jgi:hypothetical protein
VGRALHPPEPKAVMSSGHQHFTGDQWHCEMQGNEVRRARIRPLSITVWFLDLVNHSTVEMELF